VISVAPGGSEASVARSTASDAEFGVHSPVLRHGPSGADRTQQDTTTITITPVITKLPAGGTRAVYSYPDGEVQTVNTPPSDFDPLTATTDQLALYNFPQRPTDRASMRQWTAAMRAFKRVPAPQEAATYTTDADIAATNFATVYGNWAGYTAGTRGTTTHTFSAVKTNFTIPSISGTACSNTHQVGFWIGLGGDDNGANDLVQQGAECGSTVVHPAGGAAFYPFTEFIPAAPKAFCSQGSWSLAAGHVTYENMSYQTSAAEAYFYFEDETTGTAHSCSSGGPSGYTFHGNVADWIAESPAISTTVPDFSAVTFTDTNAELNSSSSWVTLGSRTENKYVFGSSSSTYCMAPGSVASNGAQFTVTWHTATCGQ
jgi:hypothetical protein